MIPSDEELRKMLDATHMEAFIGRNSAFLGSLLCSHEFQWDYDGSICPDTACTDGKTIWWHVEDFLRCSKTEKTITLLHELWHTGRLHFLRQGNRCADIWNVACDYRINNDLIRDGFKLPDNGMWVFDPSLDANGIMSEEDIYDLLIKNGLKMPPRPMNDLKGTGGPPDPNAQAAQLAAAVRALQAADMVQQAGNLPGNLKQIYNQFLQPKVDWKIVLQQWMTELLPEQDYSWGKRNRRYHEIYMPSVVEQEGRLEHLAYIQDVSGSIGVCETKRFNSEIKYIKEELRPKKLTLLQFDTKIQSIKEFTEDDSFESMEIMGGGGTSLACVHEWLEANKVRAAIIFSDLYCSPMQSLTTGIPIIWAVVNNRNAQVPFGKIIHVTLD